MSRAFKRTYICALIDADCSESCNGGELYAAILVKSFFTEETRTLILGCCPSKCYIACLLALVEDVLRIQLQGNTNSRTHAALQRPPRRPNLGQTTYMI
jgi:hypothetical protein